MADPTPKAAPLRPRVLFVCMGNICRSPAGEGLFLHLLESEGLGDRVDVDSAGTIAHHTGERPDRRMRQAAERRGYELPGRARQIRADDLDHFDLVLAMDRDNLRDIQALDSGAGNPGRLHRAEVRLLSSFLEPGDAGGPFPEDVPDPYYGGAAGFEQVLDMVEAACPRILDHLLALPKPT